MNKFTLIGAALVCAGLGFGALQYFGAGDGVGDGADMKVDKVVEAPAPTAAVENDKTAEANKRGEVAKFDEANKRGEAAKFAEANKQENTAKAGEEAGVAPTDAFKVDGAANTFTPQDTVKAGTNVAEKKNDKSYIYIKKGAFMLYFIDNEGKQAFSAGCAVGLKPGQKEKEGDMKTPIGTFYVDEICDASYWTHDFGDGKGVIEGAYGPWFISINTDEMSKGQWGGIGIHGTHDPASIGTRASEGCIRLENSQVEVLKKLVSVGTKVVIEE